LPAVAGPGSAFFGGPDAAQKGYAMRSHALRDAQIGKLAPAKSASFGTDARRSTAQRSDNKERDVRRIPSSATRPG